MKIGKIKNKGKKKGKKKVIFFLNLFLPRKFNINKNYFLI